MMFTANEQQHLMSAKK